MVFLFILINYQKTKHLESFIIMKPEYRSDVVDYDWNDVMEDLCQEMSNLYLNK